MSLLFSLDTLTTLLASALVPLFVYGFMWKKYRPVRFTNFRNYCLFTLFVGLSGFFIFFILVRSREVEPILKAMYSLCLSAVFRKSNLFYLVMHDNE